MVTKARARAIAKAEIKVGEQKAAIQAKTDRKAARKAERKAAFQQQVRLSQGAAALRASHMTEAERAAESRKTRVVIGVLTLVVAFVAYAALNGRADSNPSGPPPNATREESAPAIITVPAVSRMPLEEAVRTLRAAGLSTVPADCAQLGRDPYEGSWIAVATDPSVGTSVEPGTEVWVCIG